MIAAIIGTNAFVLVRMHQSDLREIQTNLLRQSLTLSELTERTFESVDSAVLNVVDKVRDHISIDGDLQRLEDQEFYEFLKEKTNGLAQLDALGVLDADGKVLSLTRGWPVLHHNIAYRDYFQALQKDRNVAFFVSEPVANAATGTWVIILARPVVTAEGKFLGVVFGSMSLKYYETMFYSTSLGDGYAATLLRQDGTLLARYPVSDKVGIKMSASVLTKLVGSKSGVSRSISPVDGQARIAAAYRLSNYPLVIVVTQSEEAAFLAWRTTAISTCLLAAVMIVIIIAAALFLARSWRQQEHLDRARAEVIESDKIRALSEVELNRQRDLAEQSRRLTAAVENMTQGLCMFDKDFRLVVCNELYAKMYRLPAELHQPGAPRGDIIAHRIREGILKGSHGDVAKRLSKFSTLPITERSSQIDEHADGTLIRVVRQPMQGGGWVATHDDITEQRRAEQELDKTKRFLDSIIDNIPLAVVVKDAKTRKFMLVNRAFEKMLDLSRDALLGQTVFDIYQNGAAEFVDNGDSETLRGDDGANYSEYEVESPTQGNRVHATKRIVIRDNQGDAKYLIAVIEDITDQKTTEQRIAFMAHHDALTGLANRAALAEKIEDAAARQRRRGESFGVLLLDLDRFKQVNDTLGHPAGDALLREVARRLKSFLRETDVLARLGGDEFAIIQSSEANQRDAASALAERIIEMFGKPFDIEGSAISVSTSIGIALAPEHAAGSDNLLKMSDLALYRAKSAGRNTYCFFDPQMSEVASTRHEIESELRRAIEQNELELHYQPIIDANTRKICSAEALIRWRHPTKGLILPDRFIPLAEETGLITKIGEWVLHTACIEAANWPSNVKVAVNLSPVQFRRTNFTDVVIFALADSGLPPERLELEITETALIESATECLSALRHFKSLGIAIALDDFGTGYSSLSQLTMFPFDRIKIDKSFTQNLTKRVECAAIISAALTLAQSLDIATTAEGVETKEQYRILKLAGVKSLQGYLFRRPGPASDINFDDVYGDLEIEDAA
jgi:diguanylate cyclase (GGDEF)-like protein/PAS domain S-box-containing protein